jgi:Tfp pilus assembly protein PilP
MLLLFLVAIGIWGTVFYRVMTGMKQTASVSPDSANRQVEVPVNSARTRAEREPYEGRFRDPFMHALEEQRSQKPARSSEPSSDSESEEEMERSSPVIRLELVGVVEETALLQHQGKTYLVTAGDTVQTRQGSVVVTRVNLKGVVATRKDRTDTLRLPQAEWTGRLDPEK